MNNKNELIELLNKYDFKYLLSENTNTKFHGFGLGDMLYSILFLQNNIITSP
jgi:hypothetical protein